MNKKQPQKHTYTVTELRNNIYQLIDLVIETGEPLVIDRKGVNLKIEVDNGKTPKVSKNVEEFWEKLESIGGEKAFNGTDEELMNITAWDESQWREPQII